MAIRRNEFGVWDYLVFVAMLVVSAAIGIYFALRGGKHRTQGEYLMANRSMSILPVAISILVSFISAILILGTPAEMYTQGTEYSLSVVGKSLGIAAAAVFFVPLLYPLKITSVFEYLELRFKSRTARLMGALLMIITQIMYVGIAAFAPATAFESITGFPVWATILITGVVATFYTSIGGMKAVVWTDVFQGVVMLAGILAIVIQGIVKVGGLGRVWSINEQWGRIKFFNFDPDPTVRHTVWNLFIGMALTNLGTYGINQASVQRYSSLPSLAKAKLSVMLNIIGIVFLILCTCLAGIVMFAYYADKGCDPLALKLVDNSNQLITYFVMETLNYPGVPGLFVSSLFSGALSSVSSSLNALAAITWEDILKPHYDKVWSETKKTTVTQISVVVYGCLSLGVSFAVQNLEGTVLQVSNSFIAAVSGPLTGMFILGAFFPWANSYGVVTGAVCSLAISMWLAVGTYVSGISLVELPHPNGSCFPGSNMTEVTETTTTALVTAASSVTTLISTSSSDTTHGHSGRSGMAVFYGISYLWYSAVAIIIAVTVGLLTSFITGPNSIEDIPMRYQIPLFSWLCCCLPKSVLYKLNCCRHFDEHGDYALHENEEDKLVKSVSLDTSFNDSKIGKNKQDIRHTGVDVPTKTDPIIAQKLEWYGTVSESKDSMS